MDDLGGASRLSPASLPTTSGGPTFAASVLTAAQAGMVMDEAHPDGSPARPNDRLATGVHVSCNLTRRVIFSRDPRLRSCQSQHCDGYALPIVAEDVLVSVQPRGRPRQSSTVIAAVQNLQTRAIWTRRWQLKKGRGAELVMNFGIGSTLSSLSLWYSERRDDYPTTLPAGEPPNRWAASAGSIPSRSSSAITN